MRCMRCVVRSAGILSYFLGLRRSQISTAIEPTTPIAAIPEKASISGTAEV